MHHPLFWSPELRLSFLRDTSDRIEKTSETDLINALEGVGSVAFGGKWGDRLDAALITDMGRYRKYNFESIRDLLRYIRNKSGHYRELTHDLKVRWAALITGFDFVF
jgi:serine/threonine-protein kinase/endoribonuclease IRE1